MLLFLANSILLGAGLAMDAFSVSCANALREPSMPRPRMALIAGVYAWFQFMMPMIGWFCVHEAVERFTAFQPFIPWIALALLLWIGGKMIFEGLRGGAQGENIAVSGGALLAQGVATSIDALSVGFTIEEYNFATANVAAFIIAAVTFAICMGGLKIGKIAGTKLSWKASVLGGCILIGIGIEIFVKDVFF